MAPRIRQQAFSRLALTPGFQSSLPLRSFRSLRPKPSPTTQTFLLGTAAGASLRILITPPVPPAPGTPEDEYTTSVLHSQAAALPIVRQLTADPAFESWAAYQTLTPEHRAQHIMAGSLSGARGVGGYQRIFYNASTGEFVSVVFLGSAITGWPGVVHGGALATLLDESMARAAFRQWGGRSGVTANLQLEYKAMTLASGFYVVRLRARDDEELEERERGKRHYKSFVDASVEDAATGRVTVVARALFVGGQGNGKGKVEAGPKLAKVEENQKF
ncbi:HotDog domain-containing protein [Schizothecium vesticola]|uniref:HotDog domain-containing protein n=1 Tax=Schizothecium vesticola TaxID=314040 RepID=A0AA40F144_9PEZI|nr:HotDog domain-containing protein [Schizothecium vesticola]